MDVAFSLSHSRMLHGGVGTSNRHQSHHRSVVGHFDFRGRCFSRCAILGDSRTVSKLRFSGKNRLSGVSGCWNNPKVVSVGEFKVLNSKRGLCCKNNILFMGSRVIWSKCQGSDSLAYVSGNGRNVEYVEGSGEDSGLGSISSSAELDAPLEEEEERKEGRGQIGLEERSVDELQEVLQKALKELEVARVNSTMFEEKVKKISETAIFLHDEAASAWTDVNSTLESIQEIASEESIAKEAVNNATMALSFATTRLQVALESLEAAKKVHDLAQSSDGSNGDTDNDITEQETALLVAQEDIKECQTNLATCEEDLRRLQIRNEELQKEVDKLQEIAEKAQLNAVKAEEDVTNIMLLAEQAVAFELEATQRVNDAEIALQRADKSVSSFNADTVETIQVQDVPGEEKAVQGSSGDVIVERDGDLTIDDQSLLAKLSPETASDKTTQTLDDLTQSDYLSDHDNAVQTKKQETQKDMTRDSSPFAPKALLKKSSRFFSASFFSSTEDGTEFSPTSVFQGFMLSAQKQLPKLILGLLLMGAGCV